jgi:hypothetical protein
MLSINEVLPEALPSNKQKEQYRWNLQNGNLLKRDPPVSPDWVTRRTGWTALECGNGSAGPSVPE